METSLHRDLKSHFAGEGAQFEVTMGRYRIDAVDGDTLIEIQHGSLSAIRDKVRTLLRRHTVHVVKPLVARKRLVKRRKQGGRVVSERWSPKRCGWLDLFHELVYFTGVFPHRRLTLHVPLVEVEEWRYPGHGRKRRWREGDVQIEDQKLLGVCESRQFHTADDLWSLLPDDLPSPFHTGQLADRLEVDRWVAQRIAYCLRQTGAARTAGKVRGAWLYEMQSQRRSA